MSVAHVCSQQNLLELHDVTYIGRDGGRKHLGDITKTLR